MQLPNDNNENREILLKTSLLLLGIALNAVEYFLPRIPIFPWLKPGFANIITIIWIIKYGYVETLLYALLRLWIVSFYFGFSFITFSLGLSGAFLAVSMMSLFWNLFGKRGYLGIVGVAIIGALGHNLGQIIVVYFLMAKNPHLFYQIPFMVLASVLSGIIIGIISSGFFRIVSKNTSIYNFTISKKPQSDSVNKIHIIYSVCFLICCMGLVFVDSIIILLASVFSITIIVQIIHKGSVYALLFPIKRFWMLFLFIAILHSFFTYGTKYQSIPFITHEGVQRAIVQWLRLWVWLETSFVFFHFKFHTAVLHGLQILFSAQKTTVYAGLLAAEYFPSVLEMVQKKSVMFLKLLITNPSQVIQQLFEGVVEIIERQETQD